MYFDLDMRGGSTTSSSGSIVELEFPKISLISKRKNIEQEELELYRFIELAEPIRYPFVSRLRNSRTQGNNIPSIWFLPLATDLLRACNPILL